MRQEDEVKNEFIERPTQCGMSVTMEQKMEIFLDGIIGWDVFASDVRDKLKEAGDKDVVFKVSSPGGMISEGLAISNLMRSYKGKIEYEITGFAASMATYLAMFADTVTVFDNSIFMIHNAQGVALGDYREMQDEAELLEKMTAMLASAYAKKTGKEKDVIRQMMDDETYLFGDEIKKEKFADIVIETEEKMAKDERITELNLSMQHCQNVLTRLGRKEDFEKAVALMKSEQPPAQKNDAGINNVEGKVKMTLHEMLDQNPQAYREYENSIAEAKKAGADEVKNVAKKIAAYMQNDSYKSVIASMSKVLQGEMSIDSLDGAIIAIDAAKAEKELEAAAKETDELGDTPAGAKKEPKVELGKASSVDEIKALDRMALGGKE